MSIESKNQRASSDPPLKVDLSSHIVTSKERKPIRCLGVDFSRNTIGIVAFEKVEKGSELVLVLKERGVELEVVSCTQDTTKQNIFRIELKTNNPAYNLITLLVGDRILKPNDIPPQPAKPEVTTDSAVEVDYPTLQAMIGNLRTTDQGLLRLAGLGKLADTHKCYPAAIKNVSVIILVASDFAQASIKDLPESEAMKKIMVLKKTAGNLGGSSWAKIWPK